MKNVFNWQAKLVYTEKRNENDLRKRGFKITPQRRTVIKAIVQSHEHLMPAAIHERVKSEHPGIGLMALLVFME